MPGKIALVGSGEWLPVMLEIEKDLFENQKPVYVQLSTAAGLEGENRLNHWKNLGFEQSKRLGVEQRWLPVFDAKSANDVEIAEKIKDAGVIYLSGGDPTYLSETLRDSIVWKEIINQWNKGTSLAGCSAGAMAFTDWVPRMRIKLNRKDQSVKGLGLLPHIRVIPHFDRMLGWVPDLLTRYLLNTPENVTLVGIDEDTALVGDGNSWIVKGRQSVWVLTKDGRKEFKPGSSLITN
jgi:cyanophycinase